MNNYKEVYDTQEEIHFNKVEQIKQENGTKPIINVNILNNNFLIF